MTRDCQMEDFHCVELRRNIEDFLKEWPIEDLEIRRKAELQPTHLAARTEVLVKVIGH